jgi:hypothetical protein
MSLLGKVAPGLLAIGAYKGKTIMERLATQPTQFTNPIFNAKARGQIQGFGKRGIDANRLNTANLTQSLHNNRRRS